MAANSLIFHILIHDQMLKRPAWMGVFMNHDKYVTDWAFQIALTLSNVRASQHVVLLFQLVDVHISLQWKNVRRRVSWDCTILEPATTKTHSIYLKVHQNPVLISILPSWGIYPAKFQSILNKMKEKLHIY